MNNEVKEPQFEPVPPHVYALIAAEILLFLIIAIGGWWCLIFDNLGHEVAGILLSLAIFFYVCIVAAYYLFRFSRFIYRQPPVKKVLNLPYVRVPLLFLLVFVFCGLACKTYLWEQASNEREKRVIAHERAIDMKTDAPEVIDWCEDRQRKELPAMKLKFGNEQVQWKPWPAYKVTGTLTGINAAGKIMKRQFTCEDRITFSKAVN